MSAVTGRERAKEALGTTTVRETIHQAFLEVLKSRARLDEIAALEGGDLDRLVHRVGAVHVHAARIADQEHVLGPAQEAQVDLHEMVGHMLDEQTRCRLFPLRT